MRKNEAGFKFIVVLVLGILINFSLLILQPVNSWFTSGGGLSINFDVRVGGMNLVVKQLLPAAYNGKNELVLYENGSCQDNVLVYSSASTLGGSVLLDTDIDYGLNITITNRETTNDNVKLKFKMELYACGYTKDTLLTSTIAGYVQPTSTTAGFVKNSDGYYHYVANNAANAADGYFAKGSTLQLMTGFRVTFDDTYAIQNAATGKIILTIVTYE